MIKNSNNVVNPQMAIYRPLKQAAVPIMMAARSAGHYVVRPGWKDRILRKHFVELFWGVTGTGVFIIDGKEQQLGPEQVCFYFPGDVHEIRAGNELFEYYWMTFDGPGATVLIDYMQLRREPFYAGPCPTAEFIRLIEALRDFSPSGQYRAGALEYEILSMALGYVCSGDKPGQSERYKQLVTRNYNNAAWDVNAAAEEMQIHRSTLSRNFKAETGLSPGEFLQSFRVQEALSLLKGTALRIGDVAEKVGLPDQNYFAKVIKQATGMTPLAFRRS